MGIRFAKREVGKLVRFRRIQFLNGSQRLELLDTSKIAFMAEFYLVTSSLDPRDGNSYFLSVRDLRKRSPHVLFQLPPHPSPIYFNQGLQCYPYASPVSAFDGSPAPVVLTIVILDGVTTVTITVVVHPQSLYGLMEQK